MKKSVLALIALTIVLSSNLILAETCELDVSVINQDPYPAIPGEEVKVVFQITGIENPTCGTVTFEVNEDYPFTVDPSSENPIVIQAGSYERGYSSFYVAPYTLRIDEDALDGDTPLEVTYSTKDIGGTTEFQKEFQINVEDSKADFEIYVKDYDYATKTLTLEVLNIEKSDVEALTLEILKQDNIEVKGSNRIVVGDLDSNEYTTADFEATPQDGKISVNIYYTDSINVRRSLTKEIEFDSSYFTGRTKDQKSTPWIGIIITLAVVAWIVYRVMKKRKDKNKRKQMHKH